MTDTACSTCGDIAVRLLGGSCQACASLRPLPPGAPEAVQRLTAECRAEGVPAGLLRPPMPEDERAHMVALADAAGDGRLTSAELAARIEAQPTADPAEAAARERLVALLRKPAALPASIEEAIDELETTGVEYGMAPLDDDGLERKRLNASLTQIRAAIRAELDATERRWTERQRYLVATEARLDDVHAAGLRSGLERMRTAKPAVGKRYRDGKDGSVWRRADDGTTPIELRRDVPADHPEAHRWLWVSAEDLARDWTEVTPSADVCGPDGDEVLRVVGGRFVVVADGVATVLTREDTARLAAEALPATPAPSSGDVCGARAAAWQLMPAEARVQARGIHGWTKGPLCIPCPPEGCGAAAGEPCREAEPTREADRLRGELSELRKRYLAQQGELHRALARAERAEAELAALRPAPMPSQARVAPFCFGCGEHHPCACSRAGSQ